MALSAHNFTPFTDFELAEFIFALFTVFTVAKVDTVPVADLCMSFNSSPWTRVPSCANVLVDGSVPLVLM